MIPGAIIGGVIGLVVWLIMASKANATPSAQALGMNPAVMEVLNSPLPPQQVFEKLRVANGTYRFEENSTPDAILLRRSPDWATGGYAILLRTAPEGTGTRISVSMASLNANIKKVMPAHYNHFRKFLLESVS